MEFSPSGLRRLRRRNMPAMLTENGALWRVLSRLLNFPTFHMREMNRHAPFKAITAV
jgi:hypothetical protein